jgi:hypothetical protein
MIRIINGLKEAGAVAPNLTKRLQYFRPFNPVPYHFDCTVVG